MSVYLSCLLRSPFHVIFFEASHWPSGHMIRSRPLINRPSAPPSLPPQPQKIKKITQPNFFLQEKSRNLKKKSGDKSGNLSKIVSVLLSASFERFFVSCMWDFSSSIKKHCENRKKLRWEHLMGCLSVMFFYPKMWLLLRSIVLLSLLSLLLSHNLNFWVLSQFDFFLVLSQF